jgi:hypothetical protein
MEIKHRETGAVLFSADLPAEHDGATGGVRLGVAVKLAVKARADLTGAYLARANLAGAYLADANLAGANLAGAYLAGAYLADANLAGANLAGAYLARAYLADANLAGANLAGAYLARAYLARADLSGANLAGAYLARAYLADANLAGANLAGAYLARANLSGAKGVINAGTPDGWRCVGWVRDGVLRVRAGCRDMTIPEGREYWSGKPDRREVLAALDYIEATARSRGWVNGGEVA